MQGKSRTGLGLIVGLGLVLTATAGLAGAQKKAPQKIFVAAVQSPDKALGASLEIAVCSAATNDKRFESICFNDVKALMQADALTALMGSPSGCAGEDCAERVAERVKADTILITQIAPLQSAGKSLSGHGHVLTLSLVRAVDGKTLAKVEEKCNGDENALFDRSQAATKKLLAQIK